MTSELIDGKSPSAKEAATCLYYRKQSKMGAPYNSETAAFCEYMLSAYPEWYKRTQEQVNEETKPFGSNGI